MKWVSKRVFISFSLRTWLGQIFTMIRLATSRATTMVSRY